MPPPVKGSGKTTSISGNTKSRRFHWLPSLLRRRSRNIQTSPSEATPKEDLRIQEPMPLKEAAKKITEEKSDRAETLMRLTIFKEREEKLKEAYDSLNKLSLEKEGRPLDGYKFLDRVLLGVEKLSIFASDYSKERPYVGLYKFVESFLKRPIYSVAYFMGEFYSRVKDLNPAYFKALETHLHKQPEAREETLRDLLSNWLYFQSATRFLTERTLRMLEQEQKTKKEKEQVRKAIIKFLNSELIMILKGRELREVEYKGERAIKELIALGEMVEEVKAGIEKKDGERLKKVVYKIIYKKNGEIEIKIVAKESIETDLATIKTRFKENQIKALMKYILTTDPEKAIPTLIEAAVFIQLDRAIYPEARSQAVNYAISAVIETFRNLPDSDYSSSENNLRERIIQGLIIDLINAFQPKSVPEYAQKLAGYHEAQREIIEQVLSQLPEAGAHLAKEHTKLHSPGRKILRKFGIKDPATQLLEPLIMRLVQNILSKDELLPVFAAKSQREELQEIVLEIAKENHLLKPGGKINQKIAKILLLLAAKIQLFTELVRAGELETGLNQLQELSTLNRSKEAKHLEIPGLDLLTTYFQVTRSKKRPEHTSLNYLALASTNGNMPAGKRVLEILKEDAEVWEALQKLAFNLALNVFSLRYAYCFLAQNSEAQKRNLEDLKSILAQDKDGKHLFMALQKIPLIIRGQSPTIYGDAFAQMGEKDIILELFVFWNLLNTRGLDHRLDRQEIAAKIIDFIRNDWDQGELWEKLLILAESNNFVIINQFFRSFLKNIKEKLGGITAIKGNTEREKFEIRMAICPALDIIASAMKDPA